MILNLPPALAGQICAQAAQAAPAECCGLLEGMRMQGRIDVTAVHAARNLSDNDRHFLIDPADHFAAQKTARRNGHLLVGCYHSHPGGKAAPSAQDRDGAVEKDFVWLIAAPSAGGCELAAYVCRDDGLFADLVMSSE